MNFARIATRIYGAPLLILPEKAETIEAVFRSYATGEMKPRAMEDPEESAEQRARREQERRAVAYAGISLQNKPEKPYALTTSGIALVPVLGTLVQRGSSLDAASGLTSYDYLASLLDRSMSDPEVRAVLLEVDSGGGEVAGVMDLAGRIQAASKKKPIWSVAAEQAYSAAYWLGASAEFMYVALTGGVGSIGALMLHVDQSKRDSMMGLKYTYIASGAKKAAGNPHEPIADTAALAWAQAEVDRTAQLFASAVATRRGIAVEDVLGLQAGLLTPPEALDQGYVDGVNSLIEVVALLDAELMQPGSTAARVAAQRQSTKEQLSMSTKAEQDAAAQAKAAEHEEIRVKAKAEGVTEGAAAGTAAGKAEGTKAERERIGAILGCEEANGRASLALHLAMKTDNDLASAKALLGAAPKEAGGQAFAAAMASLANPKLGTDGDLPTSAAAPKIDRNSIFESRRQASASAS